MNSKAALIAVIIFILALAAVMIIFIQKVDASQSHSTLASQQAAEANAEITKLRAELKKTNDLVPDQAAIMSHVGYHFSNLWFAVDQENWPLADFYLGETRANIKWAIRSKPTRKGTDGKDFDLGAIAQALDNTQFTALKKSIDTKQKREFETIYNDTLSMCYACHKTSGKPYLRPQIPSAPDVHIINLDPKAQTPQ